ncbi:MAG: hypothetical protein CBB68_02355 [Rhodospirillaceae bacterium TMED8]|nr:peptidase M23 [Magnetovibrio sp.]OUT52217.1 MAG: hypothetical protein CBB68_02355 [Rhodospirillaceae bacterium TMED8]|tara:strand:- start:3050 stop:3871 length:822 start_codon:yes stop_codon:yes gene_type:complete
MDKSFFLIVGLGIILGFPATACDVPFQGEGRQGGLMIGTVPKSAKVLVDGKRVRVSSAGRFLLGFGRDHQRPINVQVHLLNGHSYLCTLSVTPQVYEIQRIDGLPQRQVTPDQKAIRRIRAENAIISEVRRKDTGRTDFLRGFQWPLKGRISGIFGSQRILNGKPRRPHNGVDIAAPIGTPILAPAAGKVVLVHSDMFFTGKSIMLDHGHGLTSIYVHMSAISVIDGEEVDVGEEIGKVGKTGRATGPHLHWGVSLFHTHLDPILLTGPMPSP